MAPTASRAPSIAPDDEVRAFMAADSSPESSPLAQRGRKRVRTLSDAGGMTDSDQVTPEDALYSTPSGRSFDELSALDTRLVALQGGSGTNARMPDFVKREGKRMKISAEGIAFSQSWVMRPPSEREALMMLKLQALTEQVAAIVKSQPKYEISDDFKKNIEKHAFATLLSTRLSHYKGPVPCSITEGLLKKYCANELPSNYDRNVADSNKVRMAIQTSQTQTRSKWKKLIRASMQSEDKEGCQDIYSLTSAIVDGQCNITPAVCARVALLRKVYSTKGSEDEHNYWGHVDAMLAFIRNEAKLQGKGDIKKSQHKLEKAMAHILEADRSTYGREKEDQTEQDEQDGYQGEVDEHIIGNGSTL